MAYQQDFKSAAKRHLIAARTLFDASGAGTQPGCRAVAGYIFGVAGELAVKQMMRESGMKPSNDRKGDDPFYAHFPDLKTRLADKIHGRRHTDLRKVAQDASLFQNWSTDLRYAPTTDIQERWVLKWKVSAEKLVGRIDLL